MKTLGFDELPLCLQLRPPPLQFFFNALDGFQQRTARGYIVRFGVNRQSLVSDFNVSIKWIDLIRDRAQPAAICRHRHHGPVEGAQRSGDRGGAGPRTHPHPQRRRADDGDRGDHRRRGRLLRRVVLPEFHQLWLEFRRRTRSSWSSSSSSSSDSDRKGSGGGGAVVVIIIAVALIALAWLLSQVVRLALSRSRELLADAGSVELTKNPDAMISALRKIENRGELPGATSAVMELCVDNPREGFADLFATHPSVDSRVQALVKFAGGHDPGPAGPAVGYVGCAGRSAAGKRSSPAATAIGSMGPCRRIPPAHRAARHKARHRVPGSIRPAHGAAIRVVKSGHFRPGIPAPLSR